MNNKKSSIGLMLIMSLVMTLLISPLPAAASASHETTTYTVRNDKTVQGEIYVPNDGQQKHPAVILAHGFGNSYSIMSGYASYLAEQGFITFAFNLRANGEDNSNATVNTEAETLNAIIEEAKKRNDVDTDNIFLMGMSQGGFVSTHVAAERKDIKAMVLLCPAYVLQYDAWCVTKDLFGDAAFDPYTFDPQTLGVSSKNFNSTYYINKMSTQVGGQYMKDALSYNIYSEMKSYTGPVLIYHGDQDTIVPITYAQHAADKTVGFRDVNLITLPGQGHMINQSLVINNEISPADFFLSNISYPNTPKEPDHTSYVDTIAYAPDIDVATKAVNIPDRADESEYVIGTSKVFYNLDGSNDSDESTAGDSDSSIADLRDKKHLLYIELSGGSDTNHYMADVIIKGTHFGHIFTNTSKRNECYSIDDASSISMYSTDGKSWEDYNKSSDVAIDWGEGVPITVNIYASSDEINKDNVKYLVKKNLIAEASFTVTDDNKCYRTYPSTSIKAGSSNIVKREANCRFLTAASNGEPSCFEELTVDLRGVNASANLTFAKDNKAAETKIYSADTYYPYRIDNTASGYSASINLTGDTWVAVRWFNTTGNDDYRNFGTNQIGNTEYYLVHVINPKSQGGGSSGGGGGGAGGGGGGGASSDEDADDGKTDDEDNSDTDSNNIVSIDEENALATIRDDVSGDKATVPIHVIEKGAVYRMYDPIRGEHFYTKSEAEANYLKKLGWKHESESDFTVVAASDRDAVAVYRLYNPNGGGMHFYTDNADEAKMLRVVGWNYEGISHYVYNRLSESGVSQYRLYNPNSPIGEHNWTTDNDERMMLIAVGWIDEGVSWKLAANDSQD